MMTEQMKQQETPKQDPKPFADPEPTTIDIPEQKQLDPNKEQQVQKYMNEKIVGNFTKQELDVLQSTIAKGTNKDEFRLFIQTAKSAGLNPFLNHIYPIVYDGRNGRQLNIQISVEGILSLARKVPGFRGVETQLIHENDEFKASIVKGEMKVVQHDIGFPRGQVIGAYAIARRVGFPDVVVLMEVKEIEKMKTGSNAKMWTTWFNDMFRKHVLKRAAKEQFGIELTENEIVAEGNAAPKPVDQSDMIETEEDVKVSAVDVKKNLWSGIRQTMDDKQMNPDDLQGIIFDKFPGMKNDDLNPQQLAGLQKFVEFFKKESPAGQQQVTDVEFDEVDESPKKGENADEGDSIFD